MGGKESPMTNQPMNLQETIEAVRAWGIAKGITGPNGKATLLGQLAKTQEELTETRDAAVLYSQAQFISVRNGKRYETRDELIDGLGDVFVTIILAAEMAGLRIEDCLQSAYDEIKGRTGTMQGGVFVKDKPC
jgi:NTP pyrophosphatase (non-canonical NTP hydrolase)